jgi:hypothetical protein
MMNLVRVAIEYADRISELKIVPPLTMFLRLLVEIVVVVSMPLRRWERVEE